MDFALSCASADRYQVRIVSGKQEVPAAAAELYRLGRGGGPARLPKQGQDFLASLESRDCDSLPFSSSRATSDPNNLFFFVVQYPRIRPWPAQPATRERLQCDRFLSPVVRVARDKVANPQPTTTRSAGGDIGGRTELADWRTGRSGSSRYADRIG